MNNQKKVKALLMFAMLIAIVLFVTTIVQLVNISKTRKELITQQKTIEQLQKELDYHANKQPNQEHEEIV